MVLRRHQSCRNDCCGAGENEQGTAATRQERCGSLLSADYVLTIAWCEWVACHVVVSTAGRSSFQPSSLIATSRPPFLRCLAAQCRICFIVRHTVSAATLCLAYECRRCPSSASLLNQHDCCSGLGSPQLHGGRIGGCRRRVWLCPAQECALSRRRRRHRVTAFTQRPPPTAYHRQLPPTSRPHSRCSLGPCGAWCVYGSALYGYSAYLISNGQSENGHLLATVTSTALAVVMGNRWRRTGNASAPHSHKPLLHTSHTVGERVQCTHATATVSWLSTRFSLASCCTVDVSMPAALLTGVGVGAGVYNGMKYNEWRSW